MRKPNAEASQRRKTLESSLGMTDIAKRITAVFELFDVAAGAGLMPAELHPGRVIVPLMA
jgi:hypothetical protein